MDENQEACDCPIDCQTINTVEAQKSLKNIVRIVHLPSVAQPQRYEVTRKLKSTIRLLCVSVVPFLRISAGCKLRTLFCFSRTSRIALLHLLTLWFERKQRVPVAWLTQNSVCSFFFAYKKYSHSFAKLLLNHRCQMDYSDYVFLYFSGPRQCNLLGSQWDSHKPPGFHPKLNCVPKTNKAFTDLEQHGGKWIMVKFSFWGGVTL